MTHNLPTPAELQDFIDDILTIKPVKIDGLNGVIAPHKMQLLLLILQQWKEQHNRVELLERFYNSRPLVDDIEASASHWRHIAVETQSILAAERERSEKFASAVAYYLYGHVRNEGWKSAATIELEEALERYRHQGEK